MSETMTDDQNSKRAVTRKVKERVKASAQKHWLGQGANSEQYTAIAEIRRQYYVTAQEYYKAALYIYDSLGVQNQKLVAHKQPFALANRNVQLFIAYSILWEAFNHIYNAAAYTDFARNGEERAPLENERTKIRRVLNPPILTDKEISQLGPLKNGESLNNAINRIVNRSSRELKELYGISYDQTLTDMDAFLQGAVQSIETHTADLGWQAEPSVDAWIVKALDSEGQPIDLETPFSPDKYRSVITWHCFQIRNNLNFVGKSDGSIDDAILIIRAFSLVEPLIGLLLQESKKAAIFDL